MWVDKANERKLKWLAEWLVKSKDSSPLNWAYSHEVAEYILKSLDEIEIDEQNKWHEANTIIPTPFDEEHWSRSGCEEDRNAD